VQEDLPTALIHYLLEHCSSVECGGDSGRSGRLKLQSKKQAAAIWVVLFSLMHQMNRLGKA
jgi:hypothetical protein